MTCWNCGQECPDNADYCPVCGCKQIVMYKNEDLFGEDPVPVRASRRVSEETDDRQNKRTHGKKHKTQSKPESRRVAVSIDDEDDWAAEERRWEEENERKMAERKQRNDEKHRKASRRVVVTGVLIAIVLVIIGILTFNLFAKPKPKETQPLSEEMQKQINGEMNTATPTPAPTTAPTTAPAETVAPTQAPAEQTESQALPLEASVGERTSEDTEGYARVGVAYAAASSVIDQEGIDNSAYMMLDGNEGTSWQEGVDGYGEGEVIQFTLDGTKNVHCITFKLGNWGDETQYIENSRPERLTVWLGDTSFEIDFPDGMTEYTLRLSRDVSCDEVYIRIDSVYPGDVYDDTCISEVGIYGS